ncbi:ATP-binding protein [Lacrimispora amygdalina]|uniref:ATP-binding protein n=1 Tax=Lacrimispora amygdalina TaxID=253257 RepID=UPI000BE25916|nr:ATP-binding protein [Lacrimispora amygdalina]
MNSDIAKERISYVAKPDSITSSEGDFLATHVAVKRLKVLDKFDISPLGGKSHSEEDIFKQYVLNPEDKHQFIAVYGQSGTGKSHLIRWFAARYEQNKPKDEVVLFIRRRDNTLKGTIRQLLDKPEVHGISNKEVYERLVKAAVSIEENKLKDLIYHNFIIEIDNDMDDHDIQIGNVAKRKLVAFLNNEIVHDYLLGKKGPIERMYSKIAEHSSVDRDTIAQFEPSDFRVSQDLYESIQRAGGDRKAERLALELLSDEKGPKAAKEIADYLNQFRNDVIQRCAGIEPGDFKQIFLDIRKELFRIDKKLTLFIEDVTSFTGVDTALLDALIEEHTGKRTGDELCRISSIVGTTNNYLQNNFKDNHKDRITKYVYIPSDVLDEEGIFEFVARYVNTMSLSEDIISDWVVGHANPEDYPIHDVVEGKNWEYVSVGRGKKINIYPFTKNSIRYFYNNVLQKGHQTPRYIIRDIIEPVVRDAIFNRDNFPSFDVDVVNHNQTLTFRIHNQIKNQELGNRLYKFMSIWGNGKPEEYTDAKNVTYISSIRKEIFEDFGFPIVDMDKISVPDLSPDPGPDPKPGPEPIPGPDPNSGPELQLPAAKVKKVNDANTLLTKWTNEKKIDISATVGAAGTVHSAIYDEIPDYLFSAINWQVEGISMDNADKVKNSTFLLVALEGQTKKEGLYTLPATWNSVNIILALIRWKEFGNKSWNYPDADFDAYLITTWTERIKKDIVRRVAEYKDGIEASYIEAAVSAEIYRTILAGEFREKNLKNFNLQALLASKPNKSTSNMHSSEWNKLLTVMTQKNADKNNQETVRKYFNIGQAGASKIIVLDSIALSKTFSKVKRNKLQIEDGERQNDDRITQRRDAYTFLSDIEERIEAVAKAELEVGRAKVQLIFDALGDDKIDETIISEFAERVKKFYEAANSAQVNVKEISLDSLKKTANLEKAISDIANAMEEDDPLNIIMAFSGDPVSVISSFVDIIINVKADVDKANLQIKTKLEALGADGGYVESENRYKGEQEVISQCKEKIERMVNV